LSLLFIPTGSAGGSCGCVSVWWATHLDSRNKLATASGWGFFCVLRVDSMEGSFWLKVFLIGVQGMLWPSVLGAFVPSVAGWQSVVVLVVPSVSGWG
jgi:hypothetical protein